MVGLHRGSYSTTQSTRVRIALQDQGQDEGGTHKVVGKLKPGSVSRRIFKINDNELLVFVGGEQKR
jgi:hypothetical protein